MFCAKCGAAVGEGASYCSSCGAQIAPCRRVKVRWWWFLIAIIIVIAICQIARGPEPQEQKKESEAARHETVSTNSVTWKDVHHSVQEIRKAKEELDQLRGDVKKDLKAACDEVRKSPEYAEYEKSKAKLKKAWAEVKAEFKEGLGNGLK